MRILPVSLVLIVLVALAFYLGWFNLSSQSDTERTNVTLSVDKGKIETDRDKAVVKVQDLGNKALSTGTPATQKSSPETTRTPAPPTHAN